MDVIDIGCELMMTSAFGVVMELAGHFGHGALPVLIALSLMIVGFFKDNARLKRGGFGLLLSLVISGLLTEVLKHVFGMPRPTGTGLGMPSGHTTVAFTMAASLSILFPACEPIFYLVAIFTGISRMYFRAHFVGDVLVGAVLGTIVGTCVTGRVVRTRLFKRRSPAHVMGWILSTVVGLSGIVFFWMFEKSTAAYMVKSGDFAGQEWLRLDLDHTSAKRFLGEGWTFRFEKREHKLGSVWATGTSSSLTVPAPARPGEHALRLRIKPYTGGRPSCETISVHANNVYAGTVHLEKGWHDYRITIPRTAVASGNMEVEFLYENAVYRQAPRNARKPMGVGFDEIILVTGSGSEEELKTTMNLPTHEPPP